MYVLPNPGGFLTMRFHHFCPNSCLWWGSSQPDEGLGSILTGTKKLKSPGFLVVVKGRGARPKAPKIAPHNKALEKPNPGFISLASPRLGWLGLNGNIISLSKNEEAAKGREKKKRRLPNREDTPDAFK